MPSARLSAFVEKDPLCTGKIDCMCDDCSIVEPKTFETTIHHLPIFEWFREGEGHLRVEAFAGSGKTTTILHAIDLAPEDNIWLATFAKRNQLDLEGRLNNPRATAQTVHSLGYAAIRSSEWGWVKTCNRFEREDDLATRATGGMPYGAKRLVGKLCTLARQLTPMAGMNMDEMSPTEDGIQTLIDLAVDFDLTPPAGESLTIEAVARATLRAMDLAAEEKPVKTGIDFADMTFLPMRNRWLQPRFDMVVVDEYQDLNLAQLQFIRATLHSYGRIVLVGDKHQAIYNFRGAGGGEVAKLMAHLRPAELALPKTYRCPRKVVDIAKQYAPGYESDAGAPDGIVDELDMDKLVAHAAAGDFILSRSNAPLMPVALALLRANKPATIRGRDIAAGLKALVRRLATGHAKNSIPEFLGKLRMWRIKETDRLVAMKREDMVANVDDKAETLNVLAHDSTSVPHLLERLDALFTDDPNDGVILSTVHKAKGLEADRVFILRNTFLRQSPCVCGHHHVGKPCRKCACPEMRPDLEREQEERNIFYVAVTRSKRHLTQVRM